MKHQIAIIDGHPDAAGAHFVHDLARLYRQGALEKGHKVRLIKVGALDFPLVRSNDEYVSGKVPPAIRAAQRSIAWADQVVIFYPLWLETMPALLKGFLEQVLRPGFAYAYVGARRRPAGLLKGRSARFVVTTGRPTHVHRGKRKEAREVERWERDMMDLCGIRPVRSTLIDNVDEMTSAERDKVCYDMRRLGWLGR